jgi:hypothetical protein
VRPGGQGNARVSHCWQKHWIPTFSDLDRMPPFLGLHRITCRPLLASIIVENFPSNNVETYTNHTKQI